MKNNLIKLTLMGMLAIGGTQTLATPNNQQNNTEKDEIVITEMDPNICPDFPHCIDLAQLEEDDQ